MLTITVSETEIYNEVNNEFETTGGETLTFEHSLVSLSKWESKWEKPFLGGEPKTTPQTIEYIRMMCLTPEVPSELFDKLNEKDYAKINEYIAAKMSATWFTEKKEKKGTAEVVTSEIIYHWMIALNIPFECQHWHLNRLLTLIKVCNKKNSPEKKMSKADLIARNRDLNAARKSQLKTTG